MNNVQGVINDIYRIPRVGVPDIIAEVNGNKISSLRVMLLFRSGITYCCAEPGCHLALHNRDRWDSVITGIRNAGYIISESSIIKVLGHVQKGVLLGSPSKDVILQISAYEYTVEFMQPQVTAF